MLKTPTLDSECILLLLIVFRYEHPSNRCFNVSHSFSFVTFEADIKVPGCSNIYFADFVFHLYDTLCYSLSSPSSAKRCVRNVGVKKSQLAITLSIHEYLNFILSIEIVKESSYFSDGDFCYCHFVLN